MKAFKHFYITILFLIFSSFSFGQLNKSSCQAMFGEFDIKSYQKLRVVTNVVGTDKAYHNSTYLDNSTAVAVFKDGYLNLKDGTGLSILLPYDKIKTIKVSPETSDNYSAILIYLVD